VLPLARGMQWSPLASKRRDPGPTWELNC